MAAAAYDFNLPADPAYDVFVNGERTVAATNTLNGAAGYASYWFARTLYLAPGKYVMTLLADDAAVVMLGSSKMSSRLIGSNKWTAGALSFEFFVMPGETRMDVLAHNLQAGADACCFTMNIARDGKLVYASSAQDWLADVAQIDDSALLGAVDPLKVTPVFTLRPNWRDGITERLEYLTDVLTSNDGTEQRRSVRIFPRRSFEAGFQRAGGARSRLDNFFVGIGRKPFLLPLWHEQYRVPYAFGLSDTGVSLPAATVLDREFRQGTLVLVDNGNPDVFEVAEIAALALDTGAITWTAPLEQSWPAGSRITPLARARLVEDPQLSNLTDRVGQVRVRFDLMEPDDQFADPADYPDTTALTAPSWGSATPLWPFKPNFATTPTISYSRDDYTLDNGSGKVDITDESNQARLVQRMSITLRGRAQVFNFRRFVAKARGRTVRFYVPTYISDVIPTGDMDGAFFDCKPAGFADIIQYDQEVRTLIGIVFRDGSPTIYRTVTSVLALPDASGNVTAERFYVDSALPAISLSAVKRIEWIVSSRFDQDAFELLHHVDDSAVVTASIVTRSVNGDGMPPI